MAHQEESVWWTPKSRRLTFYLWLRNGMGLAFAATLIALLVKLQWWELLVPSVVLGALYLAYVVLVAFYLRRAVDHLVAQALDPEHVSLLRSPYVEGNIISRAISEGEAKRQLIIKELLHRNRNLLSVVQALGTRAIASADSTEHAAQRLNELVLTLSELNTLLVSHDMQGAGLREVFELQLKPLLTDHNVVIDGDDLPLSRDATILIGMAAHELATNALKHGALREQSGRVKVSWRLVGGFCELRWSESGTGPRPVNDRRGFGSTVMAAMLKGLDGAAERYMLSDGLELKIIFPYPKGARVQPSLV